MPSQTSGYFVIGTDTGVGKTVVACALLRALAQRGLRVVGMKPVAAGIGPSGINDDVARLLAAGSVPATAAAINPYALALPVSPHLAAAAAGVVIEQPPIVAAHAALATEADCVIVEGAGGLCAPVSDHADMADVAMALGLPVILVVGVRLGCLNHALLTEAALASRRLSLAGWVANLIEPEMPMLAGNLDTLRQRLPAPCLGVLPAGLDAPEITAAGYLDLAHLTGPAHARSR